MLRRNVYADVRKGGGGGYVLMWTKADKGEGVNFCYILRTSFMDDPYELCIIPELLAKHLIMIVNNTF